jgi:pyridoxal phosphate enzyme (YggS family)
VIADRVAAVRERIARAAARAGREPEDVTLVAVSKTHGPDAVRAAFAAGIADFGENKVQEAEGKIDSLPDLRARGVRWHLVGHLQMNKVRKAVPRFELIHSVDDARLGRRLEHAAAQNHTVARVLAQVDLGGEETKHGLDEQHLFPVLEDLRGLKAVRVEGLMTLPPYEDDPERVRPFFRRLAQLRDLALGRDLLVGSHLSMGMSHDFEVAIEEGATIVRIGTAVFGERRGAGAPAAEVG